MAEPTPSSAPLKTAEGAISVTEVELTPEQKRGLISACKGPLPGVAQAAAITHCATCNDQGAVGNILTAEPCPDCSTPSQAARTAPERIWLDLGVEEAEQVNFAELGEVTWSPNNATGHGIAYVRADNQAAAAQAPAAVAVPDERAAYEMGAKGAPPTEHERILFEEWMRGHCWKVVGTWDGATYRGDAERGLFIDPHAMRTRQLWAVWRDRAALAATPALPATEDFSAGDLAEVQAEPLCWVFEDELPTSMSTEAYNALFPHSKVDGVRMFPVFGPHAAPQAQPADTLDAELLESVRAMVKFQKERGSVLQVHIDNMADLLDERDAAMAAAQEVGKHE
ncbi:hypothetical protein [Comamonas sp. 4034]|uniref:hypothetical protein n=1 Tax=Comamonas sp. 4034 TaxID=3156455 RepID=UPI003D24060A